MLARRARKAGITIGLAVAIVWLYWAVLFGPDRVNAPFFSSAEATAALLETSSWAQR